METKSKLQELFCISIPWQKLPQFQIGSVVYCRLLGDYKVVRGILYDNYWLYFLQHNNTLVLTPEYALQSQGSYIIPHPTSSYNLGDEVACDFYEIKRSLVTGIVFDSHWKIAIFNPNRINASGLPRVEIVPESYLKPVGEVPCKH